MDPDFIYAKTDAGEKAMLHRTQVTQRSLRTVLILVDGQARVADLCARTGNRPQTEAALAELEKGGFIELHVEEDSLWVESKKVEEEIRAAASNNPHPLPPVTCREQSGRPSQPHAAHSAPRSSGRDSGPASAPRVARSGPPTQPPPKEGRVFVHSQPQGALSSDFTISKYSFPPMVVGRSSAHAAAPSAARRRITGSLAAGRQLAISFAAQMKAVLRRRSAAVKPLTSPRRARRPGSLIGTLVLTLVIGIALLSLTLVFFPYEQYLPAVEAAATQLVGRPVKVTAMRIIAYPLPMLVLDKVSVGNGDEAIVADEVRVEPVLSSLTAPRKAIRKLTLSGVTLSAPSIAALAALTANSGHPAATAGIRSVVFARTAIAFGGSIFADLDGRAELTAPGRLRSLQLRSADRRLEVLLTPTEGRLDFAVDALGWRPVSDSPFFFDSLNLRGDVVRQLLTIRSMDLRLFDGLVSGTAVFTNERRPTVSGELWFERLSAERLLTAVGIGHKASGDAGGRLHFQSNAESWSGLLPALSADGEFTLQRGSLRGVDFAEAVRRVPHGPVQGGVTAFEQLSGKIRLTAVDYQLSGLVINSGLMQSTGRLQVGKDAKLSGRMELRMRGSVNQTSVPLSISGSLDNSTVQVSR